LIRRLRSGARSAALSALGSIPRTAKPGFRILVYHWVRDAERKRFAQQVGLLARTFEPVSLTEGIERLRTSRIGGRELAVTFDDGFRSALVNGVPVLEEHGFPASFFLITELVSAPPDRAERICRERLHLAETLEPFTWDDVGRLLEQGHEIGSHTRSHPNLVALSHKELDEEVRGSRADIEQQIGHPPAYFAAPYGDRARFSSAVSAAARAAGYSACLTAQRGRNLPSTDLFALRRDNVVAGWPLGHVRYFVTAA
jgi:peptidoglycan/xylan/chitin deacetylase (PgdA/CDA1 family)